MRFSIPKELYSREILFKTCYRFTDDYYVHLSVDDANYIISIEAKADTLIDNIEGEFKNELIEQINRELVLINTKNIRDMLYARAMSSSMIYLDNSQNDVDTNVEDSSAMKDWFDE